MSNPPLTQRHVVSAVHFTNAAVRTSRAFSLAYCTYMIFPPTFPDQTSLPRPDHVHYFKHFGSPYKTQPSASLSTSNFKIAYQPTNHFSRIRISHKEKIHRRMQGGALDLPPGFRFHPTDDELVTHYLCRKCASHSISVPIIKEIDLYKFDPWLLPEMALYGEKEWYFFSPRDRKYPNGSRPNRSAGTGYWKATGADKPIGKPKALGIKKALVFYAGKAPKGVKTNWIMHEYRLANVDRSASKNNNNNLRLDDWVLCRIYNKKGKIEKYSNNNNNTTEKASSMFSEDVQFENETKPEIKMYGQDDFRNDQLSTDTTDSVPRFHTDSSCSDHVVSPDVTCDKEVQSEPKWNDLELGSNPISGFDFQLNFLEDEPVNMSEEDDPFAPQVQYQMNQLSGWQDVFMYLPKSF